LILDVEEAGFLLLGKQENCMQIHLDFRR